MISADQRIDVRPGARLFDRVAAGAFLSYLALSVLIFGREVLIHPARVYLGQGPDPQGPISAFGLVGIRYSTIKKSLLGPPKFGRPQVELSFSGSFGSSVADYILYPITWMWGPTVASNVLFLVAPALAGWSAFVLFRYIVHDLWPAWLGACLFAFCPFVSPAWPKAHYSFWSFRCRSRYGRRSGGLLNRARGAHIFGDSCRTARCTIFAGDRDFCDRRVLWSDFSLSGCCIIY